MMRHVPQLLSKLFVVAMFAVLAGCATAPPIVTSNIVTPPPVSIPVLAPTNLQNMQYQLVTAATLPTFTAAVTANPTGEYFVLDRTNMEIMISNVQEMRSYILQEQATINYLAGVLKLQESNGSKPTTGTAATTPNTK
jgi:uncharacterized lipoprotein YajG